MTVELRDEYDRELEPRIYYQTFGSPYVHPSVPRQLRESLERSRRVGYDFDLAWRVAIRKAMFDHEREARHEWQRLLDDAEYVEMWRAAFERRAHRMLDLAEVMRRGLDADADVRNARRPLRQSVWR